MEFIPKVIDKVQGAVDPNYEAEKQKEMQKGKWCQIGGIAAVVAGVALVMLGLVLCAAGNWGGLAVIALSVPLFLAGHTLYVMGLNYKAMAAQPKELREYGGFGKVNHEKFKAQLVKGTIGAFVLNCLNKDGTKPKLPDAPKEGIWAN